MGSNGKRKGKGRRGSKKADTANGHVNGAAIDDEPATPSSESGGARDEAESEPGDAATEESEEKQDPAAARSNDATAHRGAAWGEPFFRFEKRWTTFESRLLTLVLGGELLALVAWVFLNGMSEPADTGEAGTAGTVFRAALGAVVLGAGGWALTKKLPLATRRFITVGGLVVGTIGVFAWRGVGVDFFANLKGWLQGGSTLTLMGGLRGVATRLTLWLAFLGGSLATGAGKHIHIDLVFRLLPKRLRLPAAVLNYLAAAMVCFAAVWGFTDHFAITTYGSDLDDPPGKKIGNSLGKISDHLFLARKQLSLDLRTLPRVLAGTRYDEWMTGKEWNAWVDDAGFESRFTADQVKSIRVPDDAPVHSPLVVSPDGTEANGVLATALAFVIPFGLLAIGIRFLLRALLSISGHIEVDPDEAHKEDLGRPADAEGSV